MSKWQTGVSATPEDAPYLFPFGIPSHNSVHNGGFAGLGVCIVFADCVNLDILRVVYVDELFIYIGAVCTGEVQVGVEFAGFVADLTSARGVQWASVLSDD